jgi:anti-sigma regulatory factor (Ser/Thr protein kinase)
MSLPDEPRNASGFELVLRGGFDAGGEARRAIALHEPALPKSVREDVQLLATELVTNAVRHGGAAPGRPLQFDFRRRNGTIRVEVVDSGIDFETPPQPTNGDANGGWGLFLVDRIAERWGVDTTARGTCVWFELPAARAP